MTRLTNLGTALQVLLGSVAEEVGHATQLIVRQRQFTALSLARTFILGFLHKPNASDKELAQLAIQCGAVVTPQAVEQRYTPKLVQFLEQLFRRGVALVVGSTQALAPVLERFTAVTLLDSTTVALPNELKERFRGCGGSHGGGQAALKLQVELDLRSGALSHLEIEPGCSPDSASTRQQATPVRGSLRITDLGYFNLTVFATLAASGAYFLSRLPLGTSVLRGVDEVIELLPWLRQQRGPIVDAWLRVGKEQQLPCRLLAWRLPPEQANRRRQRLRQELQSKEGRQPSAARLAWCDWTILLTNVPADLLTPPEAIILYRARWQMELLFKRWKTQDLITALQGSTVVRQMVRVWSRLLAALVQHWMIVAWSWGDATRSWGHVAEAVRPFVTRILRALDQPEEWESVLLDIRRVIAKTCGRNRRSKPGTAELLNDASLLDFSLT